METGDRPGCSADTAQVWDAVKKPCSLLVLPFYRASLTGTFSVKRHQRLELMPALYTTLGQHLTSLGPVGSYGLPYQGEKALPVLEEAQFGHKLLAGRKQPSIWVHFPVNFPVNSGSLFEQSCSLHHIKYGNISELMTQALQLWNSSNVYQHKIVLCNV